MTMYSVLAIAFLAFTTAAPVDTSGKTLMKDDLDCNDAVANLNIQSVLAQFGAEDKKPIIRAMKDAAQVQCGVITGGVVPEGTPEECEDRCSALNIQGILKEFGSEDKSSIWRAMKGACYTECKIIFKAGELDPDITTVQAASASSSDDQHLVTSAAEHDECQGKVADLNIQSVLAEFGQTNKKAIIQAMKAAAMTQCYINANLKVYRPSGSALMDCQEKCGNLNIQSVLAEFGAEYKKAVIISMKSACAIECDNMHSGA